MPEVRSFTAAGQLVIEVDADPGTTLDPIFRARFATEARTAPAAFYTATPGHCAARVPAGRGASSGMPSRAATCSPSARTVG